MSSRRADRWPSRFSHGPIKRGFGMLQNRCDVTMAGAGVEPGPGGTGTRPR